MAEDKHRDIFEGPFVVDMLIDGQKHTTNLLEKHTEEIAELRVCQAKKMNEINKSIHDMKDEIKEEIQAHCIQQETTCKYNHEQVDKELDKRARNSVLWALFTVIVLPLTVWIVANINILNEKVAVQEHKIEYIESANGHEAPVDVKTYGIKEDEK